MDILDKRLDKFILNGLASTGISVPQQPRAGIPSIDSFFNVSEDDYSMFPTESKAQQEGKSKEMRISGYGEEKTRKENEERATAYWSKIESRSQISEHSLTMAALLNACFLCCLQATVSYVTKALF